MLKNFIKRGSSLGYKISIKWEIEKVIENYIEKDIMRQVKILEYLFELKKIDIQEVADLLEISKVTVKRDIEKILSIDSRIRLIKENSSTIIVDFWSGATRYELVKKIYEQSFFLKICAWYLKGERNYLKISEREHISVSKFFSLKKSRRFF